MGGDKEIRDAMQRAKAGSQSISNIPADEESPDVFDDVVLETAEEFDIVSDSEDHSVVNPGQNYWIKGGLSGADDVSSDGLVCFVKSEEEEQENLSSLQEQHRTLISEIAATKQNLERAQAGKLTDTVENLELRLYMDRNYLARVERDIRIQKLSMEITDRITELEERLEDLVPDKDCSLCHGEGSYYESICLECEHGNKRATLTKQIKELQEEKKVLEHR